VSALRRMLLLLIGALALPAVLLAAAPPDAPRDRLSLKGQLLIASPDMGDPRFQQTVLVMVQHDANGAMGIVINRPLGEKPLSALLEAFGEKSDGVTGSAPIYLGGPVQIELGSVLHSSDYRRSGTLDIDGRLALTASIEVFRDITTGLGPKHSLITFGYAGWAAGQLESELALSAWYTAPLDLHLVFEEPRDKVWERALEHRTRDL
jgi:putative transcriptional regulator